MDTTLHVNKQQLIDFKNNFQTILHHDNYYTNDNSWYNYETHTYDGTLDYDVKQPKIDHIINTTLLIPTVLIDIIIQYITDIVTIDYTIRTHKNYKEHTQCCRFHINYDSFIFDYELWVIYYDGHFKINVHHFTDIIPRSIIFGGSYPPNDNTQFINHYVLSKYNKRNYLKYHSKWSNDALLYTYTKQHNMYYGKIFNDRNKVICQANRTVTDEYQLIMCAKIIRDLNTLVHDHAQCAVKYIVQS